MTYTDSDFDFWIKNNYNVLMKGKKGVGKTARILHHLERHGLSYKYFSAPTMDPWVDFIGVPKEVQVEGKSYLDLILPKSFADDEVEVIILDEYNRAPKKVRNAVMELIQFKSINGRPFKNLRFVWAAINPKEDDENYDVEELDPAQEDRFEVHIEFPYKLDKNYWVNKYGEDLFSLVNAYWSELSLPIQMKVSPRRLDYAVAAYQKGGNIKHFLPEDSNPSKLATLLGKSFIFDKVDKALESENLIEIRSLVKDPNNWNLIKSYLSEKAGETSSQKELALAVFCLPNEVRNAEYRQSDNKVFRNEVCNNFSKYYGTDETLTKDNLFSFYYSLTEPEEIAILKPLIPESDISESLDLNAKVKGLLDNFYKTGSTTPKKDALTKECLNVLQTLDSQLFAPVRDLEELPTGYIQEKWSYIGAFACTLFCLNNRFNRYNTSSYTRFLPYKELLENTLKFQKALAARINPIMDRTKYPPVTIRGGCPKEFNDALVGFIQSTYKVHLRYLNYPTGALDGSSGISACLSRL